LLQRCLILVFLFLLTACASMDDTWEGTKHAAKNAWSSTNAFVNPNPEIDLDSYKMENPNQEKLARLFTPVDQQVLRLMRFVSDQDQRPNEEWLHLLNQRFPWLNGVIVTDAEGHITDRRPPVPVKPFSSPLWFEAVWRETMLTTLVDQTDLGPEVYFGTPMYKDVNLDGLIVVHFDPRTLFSFCPEPEQLIIIAPNRGVWTPGSGVDTAAMLALPWTEILRDKVGGQVECAGKYYTWLARYVGRDLFVYATESVDHTVDNKGWFF
jgi:hypothetical protein